MIELKSTDEAIEALNAAIAFLTKASDSALYYGREAERLKKINAQQAEENARLQTRLADNEAVCAERDKLAGELEKFDPERKRAKLAEEQLRAEQLAAALKEQAAKVEALKKELSTK